jgi:DNA ligase 1
MLLERVPEPFDDDNYITELKLDGIRLTLSKFDGITKLYTRHKNEVTAKFKELLLLDLPDGIVLDGEIIVPGQNGKPDFESMMERFQSTKSQHPIQYCVFDIVYYEGQKVTHLPLLERKELLNKVLPKGNPSIVLVQWILGNGIAYFNLVVENSLEGIVLKRSTSKYHIDKRSSDWLKVINYQYENVWITGMRKKEFGLLLNFEDKEYAGVMEFVPAAHRKEFYRMKKVVTENDKYSFIKPIKCKVKYRNLTKDGKLRIPSFVEWG